MQIGFVLPIKAGPRPHARRALKSSGIQCQTDRKNRKWGKNLRQTQITINLKTFDRSPKPKKLANFLDLTNFLAQQLAISKQKISTKYIKENTNQIKGVLGCAPPRHTRSSSKVYSFGVS